MTPHYWDDAKATLTKRDKRLGRVIAAYEGEFLHIKGDGFATLARAIVGQQISVKAADSVWARFCGCVGKVQPKSVLAASAEELRACGLSGSKVVYMQALAQHFSQNKVVIKRWPEMSDEDIIKELTGIKGIGVWTAEMFLIFALGRPDVLPMLDIGLLKAVYLIYNKGEKMTKAEVLKLAERWRPYRSVATWYLWRSLDPVPVAY